jgi:hypothetical protein
MRCHDAPPLDAARADTAPTDTAAGGCDFPAEPLEGEPGAACTDGGDCDSGFCVEGPQGRVCTATCVDCCPTGFRCEAAPGRDATFICVPKLAALCRPCTADEACGALSEGALCVDYGDEGRFCGGGGAFHGGGGGGGYTGGSGGTYTKGGGGGGSYASTSNNTMQGGQNSGHGQVKISWQ